MNNVSHSSFYVGGNSTFDFLVNGISRDGGSNYFNFSYQAATYTLKGLNNDAVDIISNFANTFILTSVSGTTFNSSGTENQTFNFTANNGTTTDGGANIFSLGRAAYTFTGTLNDRIYLNTTLGTVIINNDAGGNTINVTNGGTYNFTGFIDDIVNLPDSTHNYSLSLTSISHTIFNAYSNNDFTFTLSGGVTTDAGGNIFNLYNGGTNSFKNLNTSNPDIINFHSMYSLALSGGGNVIVEDSDGTSPVVGNTISLSDGTFKIALVDDAGGNNFLIGDNSAITFMNLQNEVYNLTSSSANLTFINDLGGNVFNLLSSVTGTQTLTGVNNDTFNLQDSTMYYTFSLTGSGTETFNYLQHDLINLSGNFSIVLINDLGNNVFTLSSGGSDSFQNLNPSVLDIFNLNGSNPYNISFTGGGNLAFENLVSGPLSHDTFQLHGDYTIGINYDGGNNTFNLVGGGIEKFTNLDNTNNLLGDTINLDGGNYTIGIGSGLIHNTINGGSGINTMQFLGSSLGSNTIDGGSSGNNTADFSQFLVPNNDILNIDLANHQAYLTNNGSLVGSIETLLDFNNVIGSNSATAGEIIKLNNLSGNIQGGTGLNNTLDLSALGNAIDLTTNTPNWSNIANLCLNSSQNQPQSLTIDSNTVATIAPNATNTLAITAPTGETGTLTTAGGWVETAGQGIGSGAISMNGHTYDAFSATFNGHPQTLLIDENISNRNVH